MINPKFSIIMPCFNSQKYVKMAILSVLNQEWQNWELIIINDGSTDNTLDIVNQYVKTNNHIRVHSKKNGGYVSAVNCGLELMSGDYFLMMGSDDKLKHNFLKHLAESISDKDPDIIAFRTQKSINNQITGYDDYTKFHDILYIQGANVKECERRFGDNCNIFFVRDTSKCFKSSILEDLRYFGKYGYDADGIFSTLFSQKCKTFLCLPIDGYIWTLREDSLSAKINIKIDFDRLLNWGMYVDYLSNYKFQDLSQHAKSYLLYAIGLIKKILIYQDRLTISDIKLLSKIENKILSYIRKNKLRLDETDKLQKWRRILVIYNILYRLKFHY